MTVKIVSLNVKGLNIPHKRHSLYADLRHHPPDVVCLQETHFKTAAHPKLYLPNYPHHFHATASVKARGVSILIHQNVTFNLHRVIADPNGRYLFLICDINQMKHTIANFYCPNAGQLSFIRKAMVKLLEVSTGRLIVCGDFNQSLDLPIRPTRSQRSSVRNFAALLAEFHLFDIWRIRHPGESDYSFYSGAHKTYSRIDFFFVNADLLALISDTTIGSMSWSDHAPITLLLPDSRPPLGHCPWRLNESLLSRPEVAEDVKCTLKNYFKENSTPDVSPLTLWQAHKTVVRGVLIKWGSHYKKLNATHRLTLLRQIHQVTTLHKKHLNPADRSTLVGLQMQLTEMDKRDYVWAVRRLRTKMYLYNNKASKMMANRLRKKVAKTRIERMVAADGTTCHHPQQIAECFAQYYTKLYNLRQDTTLAQPTIQEIFPFLQRLNLPTISEAISHRLLSTPTLGELQAALSSLKVNKAPGPDGYTATYYKTFSPQLNSHLLSALSHIFLSGSASSDWLSATIVTIPKTMLPEDNFSKYRPISLLNVDAKLYAKILANRLTDIMPLLIADDQVGFIKSRQGPDNTIKAMALMDYATDSATPSLILSLDAEKAFDRLHWVFLEHTLLKFNFPKEFIKAIMALYSCPNARVLNAGFQSTVIPITNGTRQRCPLSPLLYALALEPLAQAIRQSDGIEGPSVGPTVCKLSLFADDILLTLTNPLTSLPTLHSMLSEYGNLSYHKINVHKTQALAYGIPDAEISTLKSQYPYDWRNRSLTYLGIKLSFSKPQLFKLNYTPLLHMVSTFCQQWSTVEISWAGRINAIKMMLLPKILYVFRALPLPAPMSFFKTVLLNLSQFIWRGKRPRIKIAILHQPVDRGGLGLPNLLLCYRAALMTNLGRIFAGVDLPQWTSLILPCSLPHDFVGLLWTPKSCRRVKDDLPALPALLLHVWDVTRSLLTAVHPLSLASPLSVCTHLIPDLDPRPWCRNSLNTLSSFYASHDILSFLQLQERHSLQLKLGFHFMRLRSCLAKYGLLHLPPDADILTRFEHYCLTPSPDSRLLSLIYQLLLTRTPLSPWRFQLTWERDLQHTLSADQWRECFLLDCKKFRCISLVEAMKKILYRWYITPNREHHYNPHVPRTCWRCEEEEGTFFHTWWACPRLTTLWGQVATLSSEILDAEIVPTPEVSLLQMFPDSLTKFQKQLLAHILSVTTTLIAAKWKSNVIRTVGAIKTRLSELRSFDAMARALMGLTGRAAIRALQPMLQ
uniref:Reverse transcriptase domain-containing protein n=1 Tax=Leptobrachium leishanense TaxID=445787 RepID=A0A8C5P8P1_9ANUR